MATREERFGFHRPLIDCFCCSVSAPTGAKNVTAAFTRLDFLISEISALEFAASASNL
jgi:hypothetical protein